MIGGGSFFFFSSLDDCFISPSFHASLCSPLPCTITISAVRDGIHGRLIYFLQNESC